jgi:Transmembrane adaptor Erv26
MLAAFAFMTLSLGSCFCIPLWENGWVYMVYMTASGLLYASELIEEHSRLAKMIGQRSVYVRYWPLVIKKPQTERLVNLDYCDTSWTILLRRPPAFTADIILHHLSPCIPSKLLQYLAVDFPHLNNIPRILRSCYCRPFHLVFLFHKGGQQCTALEDVSRGSGGDS